MKLLYEKLISFFSLMKPSTLPETTQKIVSLIGDIADALKRLICGSLRVSNSLWSDNKRAAFLEYLADIETEAVQTGPWLDLKRRFQDHRYLGRSADFCTVCQNPIGSDPTLACYWDHHQIFHITCTKCPSCGASFSLNYTGRERFAVDCPRRCDKMMRFKFSTFGNRCAILPTSSVIFVHLLYVAWARLANILRPNVALCTWLTFEPLK